VRKDKSRNGRQHFQPRPRACDSAQYRPGERGLRLQDVDALREATSPPKQKNVTGDEDGVAVQAIGSHTGASCSQSPDGKDPRPVMGGASHHCGRGLQSQTGGQTADYRGDCQG